MSMRTSTFTSKSLFLVPFALTLSIAHAQIIQNEVAKLETSDGVVGVGFGRYVSISGDTVIVGAEFYDNLTLSGSAFVFTREQGGHYTEQTNLRAGDGEEFDRLGRPVAISDDTVIVGASADDDNGGLSGSAYIFVRDQSGNWGEQAKLLASDGADRDFFGNSVAISGDTVIVGAENDDDKGSLSGSAYVYKRNQGGDWSEQAKLLASDGTEGDKFGFSVAISNNTAVVGAYTDDGNGSNSGSAYVFFRDPSGNWSEQAKLLASDGASGDGFGWSSAVSDDTAIIGTAFDDQNGSNSGSAYVFFRDPSGNWSEQAKLLASDGASGDGFGWSSAVSDDTAIIGAIFDDDNGSGSGSAYVFVRNPSGNWSERAKLIASDAAAGNNLGSSVAISRDTAVVGSVGREVAYVFDLHAGVISGPLSLHCPGDFTGDGVAELVMVRPTGLVRVKNLNGNWVKGFSLAGLSGVVDAEIAPDSNGNGVPELVAVDGTRSEVRDLLTGELLARTKSSQIDNALDVVLSSDRTGDGVVDASILGASPVQVQVGDSQSWAGRQTLTFDDYLRPKDLQVYPDSNANGVPEIGVLGENQNPDGSDKIELRDMATGTKVTDLWLGRGWRVVSHLLLGDLNGNGSGEAAILRLSDKDQIAVTLRDSRTKQWLGTRFFDPQYPPIKLLSLEDINSNGADEIVVFGQRFNRGNQKAQVMDAATGEILKAVFYDRNFHGRDMAVCEDLNGNGVPELAMLGERPSDGKLRVIVKDALTGERLGIANF